MKTLGDILHATLLRRVTWLRNALADPGLHEGVRRRLLLALHNAALTEIGGMSPHPCGEPAIVALPLRRCRGG